MRIRSALTATALLALPALAAAGTSLSLSPPVDMPLSIAGPEGVALGDIDGDEILDAVVTGRGSNSFVCYRGAGDGTFGTKIASRYMGLEPSDVVVGDFNGDGLPDVAAVNNACG
jgi:hypothetical protein